MIDVKRRLMLKGSLAASAVGVAVSAGLLTARDVLADWNESAFRSEDLSSALSELLGSDAHEPSDEIGLQAPDNAENSAAVRVTVESEMKGVDSIALVATGNRYPLIAWFELGERAQPFISTNIKMAESADVVALMKTGDRLYSATKAVKVTVGGCAA